MIGSVICLYTPVSLGVLEMEGIYMPLGASFFEDVLLVEFVYLVFSRMPSGVTVDESGLC